jgi:hypothetical protein
VHARPRVPGHERVDRRRAPDEQGAPVRAWIALGSPCVSVYLPVFPPASIAPELADAAGWARFARLRDRVERDGDELGEIRAVLAPIEAELWEEAEDAAADPDRRARFTTGAWRRVDADLTKLGA